MVMKSPGGSTFPYYYKNGELYGLHLGSLGGDEDSATSRLAAEQAFLNQRSRSIPVWIDLYDTRVTRAVMSALVAFIQGTRPLIPRLALVGCPALARWRLSRLFRQAEFQPALPIRFFADPEVAKTWLVSESV